MNKLLTILFILFTFTLSAQQTELFSQYMFNKLAINPGYAGSREVLTADIVYRNQWVNIDGAPKTISASMHSPLKNQHLALGVNVTNDQLGPLSNTNAMATFAYRIIFPKSSLSFGLQAGVKNSTINWRNNKIYDESDPFLSSPMNNTLVPDANFGIYYSAKNFYAGFSSRQLLQNQNLMVTDSTGGTQFNKLMTHFYGMAGVAVPVGDNVIFRPSVLAKFVKNAPPQIDLNASFLFANLIWLGASYRTEKAVSFMTEINVSQNLRIGYSYDIWLNELKAYNKGSHEIRISYDFNIYKRLLSPRYF